MKKHSNVKYENFILKLANLKPYVFQYFLFLTAIAERRAVSLRLSLTEEE